MGTGGDNGNGAPIGWMGMKNIGSKRKERSGDHTALTEVTSNDGLLSEGEMRRSTEDGPTANGGAGHGSPAYKVYKRRWFGLIQLTLLNIIVSWDVSNSHTSSD